MSHTKSHKRTLLALLGRRPPVDLLLHPLTLAGLALMILNDGWLRGAHPGWLTGKLSDCAAVLAYPGILAALWGLGAMAVDRLVSVVAPGRGVDYSLRPSVLLGACTLTGTLLVGINLWTGFRDAYLAFLGRLDVFHWFGPFHYTMDPYDLLALLMLPGVWLVGRRQFARVPTGRLRATYRRALRRAAEGTPETPPESTSRQVHITVDRSLADVRRAQSGSPTASLDALRDLLVKTALLEAGQAAIQAQTAPSTDGERNVAFDPSEHYHRLRQALEDHRSRGLKP